MGLATQSVMDEDNLWSDAAPTLLIIFPVPHILPDNPSLAPY